MRLIIIFVFVFGFMIEHSKAWYVTGSRAQFKAICEHEDFIQIVKHSPALFMAPDGNPEKLWNKIRKRAALGCLNGDCNKKVSIVCAIPNGDCSFSRNCGEREVCVGHRSSKKMKHSCIIKKSGIAPKLNNLKENILEDFY